MNEIKIVAPAKINLSLDIRGLRKDGYHDLEMIMQSISLYDIINIKKTDEGIKVKTSSDKVPDGKKNLAYKAADLLLKETGLVGGVDIFIDKRIPVAAGLAGGSTDAAAVLKGINELYSLQVDYNKLCNIASRIGSDIPFCLKGGTALATGRGDQIEQLPDIDKQHLVLVNPPVEVSTPEIYQKYDDINPELEIPTRRLVEIIKARKEINWTEGWGNVLEPVTKKLITDVNEIESHLASFNIKFSQMSGSGPTVFGIVDTLEKVNAIIENWPRKNDFITYTSTFKKDFK